MKPLVFVVNRATATVDPARRKMEPKERHRIIARRTIIEGINIVREEKEARRQQDRARQQMLAKQKKKEERERKIDGYMKERLLEEAMQQISLTSAGQKDLKKLDEKGKKLDAEQIAAKEQEEAEKERQELQQKLMSRQEKKVDYFVRAKRIKEVPLFEKSFAEKLVADLQFWDQQENEHVQAVVRALRERELAVQHRERFKRMREDREKFLENLKAERHLVYMEKLKKFEKEVEEERKKALTLRRQARKNKRRNLWQKERAEAAERNKRKAEEKRIAEVERKKVEVEALAIHLQLKKEKDQYQAEKAEEKFRRELEKMAPSSSSWRKSGAGPVVPPSREEPSKPKSSKP